MARMTCRNSFHSRCATYLAVFRTNRHPWGRTRTNRTAALAPGPPPIGSTAPASGSWSCPPEPAACPGAMHWLVWPPLCLQHIGRIHQHGIREVFVIACSVRSRHVWVCMGTKSKWSLSGVCERPWPLLHPPRESQPVANRPTSFTLALYDRNTLMGTFLANRSG